LPLRSIETRIYTAIETTLVAWHIRITWCVRLISTLWLSAARRTTGFVESPTAFVTFRRPGRMYLLGRLRLEARIAGAAIKAAVALIRWSRTIGAIGTRKISSVRRAAVARGLSAQIRNHWRTRRISVRPFNIAYMSDVMTIEVARLAGCGDVWAAVISGHELIAIRPRIALMFALMLGIFDMAITLRRAVNIAWSGYDAAAAAVVTDMADVSLDDSGVVRIVDIRDVDIVNGGVVVKASIDPTATVVTIAVVPEAVVDSAVVTDVYTPIAGMP